jgi:hypothetical protein
MEKIAILIEKINIKDRKKQKNIYNMNNRRAYLHNYLINIGRYNSNN